MSHDIFFFYWVFYSRYTIGRPEGCIHYVYHRGVWGWGQRIFGEIWKFSEGKRGDGKICKGRKLGDANFLDSAIERLSTLYVIFTLILLRAAYPLTFEDY